MNRREFIKAIVATAALTTGLARTTLAAVSERMTVRGKTFSGLTLTEADLHNVQFSECRFIDCRVKGDMYLVDHNYIYGKSFIDGGSIYIGGQYNNIFGRPSPFAVT